MGDDCGKQIKSAYEAILEKYANQMGTDPTPFVHGTIIALNCSFATPMAYQTNLMVMGPGGYRFKDFVIGGVPLIITIWIAFSVFASFYYRF